MYDNILVPSIFVLKWWHAIKYNKKLSILKFLIHLLKNAYWKKKEGRKKQRIKKSAKSCNKISNFFVAPVIVIVAKSRSSANLLLTSFWNFEFIISLFVIKGFLSYLNTISKTLQSIQIDLICAADEIKDTIDFFKAVRTNIDAYYQVIYEDCIAMCEIVSITPVKPRTCPF